MAIEMWSSQTVIFRRDQGQSDQSAVTALPNGDYAVVWRDGLEGNLKLQIINAAGEALGPIRSIMSTVGTPARADIGLFHNGTGQYSIVATWSGQSTAIERQSFNLDGTAIDPNGREVLGGTETGRNKNFPAVFYGEFDSATVWSNTSGTSNSIDIRVETTVAATIPPSIQPQVRTRRMSPVCRIEN
jgi:hypothetical protein